jgi:hypothetical protein
VTALEPRPSSPLGRRGWSVVVLLVAVDLGLRLGVAVRPLPEIDGLTVPDDAYLSLSLARAIGSGEGPRYGLGYTNGFQPLYVFLMAPYYAFQPGDAERAVHVALVLLALCDALALLLLLRVAWSWSGSIWTLLVLAAAWVPSPYVAATTANGLETILASLLIVASLGAYATWVAPAPADVSPRHRLLLGAVLGLLILARSHGTLLALALGLDWVARALAGGRRAVGRAMAGGLCVAGAALVVNLPWLLYSYRYTGALFPTSGRAVRFLSLDLVGHQPTFDNFYRPLLRDALRQIRARDGLFLLLAGGLLLATLGLARGRAAAALRPVARLVVPAGLFVLFLVCAYAFFIFTPWYFDRYLFPVAVVSILALAAFFDRFSTQLPPAPGRLLALALVGGLILVNVGDGDLARLYRSTERNTMGYRNLGLWARARFPRGTVLGAPQSGALGYFADDLVVVNLDGVVNAAALEALQARRALAYARSVRVEYVVGWRMNVAHLVRHSSDFREGDLVKEGRIEEFQSWGRDWVFFRVNDDR